MRTIILLIAWLSLSAPALSQNLVAHYPFDGNANDQSGNAINPTYVGSGVSLTTDRFGNANKAYNFNGAVGSYMRMPAGSLPTANRTVSLWFNAASVTNRPFLLAYGGQGFLGYGTSFLMALNASGCGCYQTQAHYNTNRVSYSYGSFLLNQWIHWVVTISGNTTKMYVNGKLVANVPGSFIRNTFVSGKELSIGVMVNAAGVAPYTDVNGNYFQGKLDDIRIYDNAMTAGQVQNLYNSAKGMNLAAYYPFNGNANDESGNAINPTYIGSGVTLTPDRFGIAGKAYNFNGAAGSYMRMPADLLPKTNRTISLWFNVPDVTNRPGLLGYGGDGSCGTTFFMALNLSGKGQYNVQGHCLKNAAAYTWSTAPVNSWNHWVMTINGNEQKIYVNGKLKSTTNTFSSNTVVAGKDFALGVITYVNGAAPYTDMNVGYLKGKLDDIRIYDAALTDEQVGQLYKNEVSLNMPGLKFN
ncbi:MAG: LamG domain-containing protein [Sphingobacteriales bacterium]|nr:LamG domain-containing protein [Sphingobacteriales bacterium]